MNVETAARVQHGIKGQGIFYGWYIVGVGFLANVASSFALASTLSIFLKPLTAELGISRGVFSLLRSGEGIIGACLAPLVGTLVDRYGGRWLMAIGAAVVGVGYFFLGHIEGFGQFAAIRLTLVTFGDALMGSMVANVVIVQWFVRRRGRALALSSMGVGFAKVCMPIVVAWLLVSLGWRQTWVVFGILTIALLVLPALLIVRRSPEEMGLRPDGAAEPLVGSAASERNKSKTSELLFHGSQFARLLLRYRSRSFPRCCRECHERDRVHAARIAVGMGTFRRAHRRSLRRDAALRRSRSRFGLGDFHRQFPLPVCWIFSLRHRARRQYGFAGYSLGQLFRPALARKSARHGLIDFPGACGRRTAVFRFSLRRHRRLRAVVCDLWRGADDLGGIESHVAAAEKNTME